MGLKLIGEVALDGSGFERGLARIGESAAHHLKGFAVGAFGLYGVHEIIKHTVETAEELVNTSKRLDIPIEQLQVLRQAAKESSVEFDKMSGAFEKLDVAREKALTGGPEAAGMLASFARLGVTQEMLKSQTAASLFQGPIAKTVQTTSVEDIAKPLKDVLGKGFGGLIPVLKMDLDELGNKMRSLGSIMSTEAAVGLKQLSSEYGLLANIIVAQVAPALISFGEYLFEAVGWIKQFSSWLGVMSTFKESSPFGAPGDALRAATIRKHEENIKLGGYYNTETPEQEERDREWLKKYDELKVGADKAASDVAADWKKMLDGIKKQLAEDAEKLKHPKPPVFYPDDKAGAAKRAPAEKDALVRVGNFLGQSSNALTTLAEKQVALLNKIEFNTRKPIQTASDGGAYFPIS